MSKIEPTLAAPMAPSRIDLAAVLARQAERDARITALRPANKERLFDGLTAAGITHVTVSFDGYRGQMLVEQHDDEGRAVNALMKLSATKKRRGYRLLEGPHTKD